MKANFRIKTPDGSFPVFSNEVREDLFVASIVYYLKRAKYQTEKKGPGIVEADIHMEEGSTEAQALERLQTWCYRKFGEPCAVSKAK